MTATELAVSVRGLVKSYGIRRAVDGLDLDVYRGETLALLGPNGAGKTTTVETMEGYRRPDSGQVRVLGCDPLTQGPALKSRIGVMPQDSGLYPAITPREALTLFARFYPHPRDPEELLRLTGLGESASTRYRRLSGGQKQRLSLALALLPAPEVIFLDEPTAGLDPQARRTTWDIIRGLHDDGVTVLLTTHYLDEAERLADRVAILDRGKLIALDTPAALVAGDSSVHLKIASPVDIAALVALPTVISAQPDSTGYILETSDAPSLLVELTQRLRDLGIQIVEVRVGHGSLEDVFLRVTGRQFEE